MNASYAENLSRMLSRLSPASSNVIYSSLSIKKHQSYPDSFMRLRHSLAYISCGLDALVSLRCFAIFSENGTSTDDILASDTSVYLSVISLCDLESMSSYMKMWLMPRLRCYFIHSSKYSCSSFMKVSMQAFIYVICLFKNKKRA